MTKDTDRARRLRIDALSVQQEENPSTVNQLLAQIQELQDKVNSLDDAKEFYDPGPASSSGMSHVPSQPLSIPNPRGLICRDSCLPHDTRKTTGSSGNVLENLPARDGPSSVSFENPRNLASSSCGLRSGNTGNITKHGEGVRREPQSSTNPNPRITRNHESWTP